MLDRRVTCVVVSSLIGYDKRAEAEAATQRQGTTAATGGGTVKSTGHQQNSKEDDEKEENIPPSTTTGQKTSHVSVFSNSGGARTAAQMQQSASRDPRYPYKRKERGRAGKHPYRCRSTALSPRGSVAPWRSRAAERDSPARGGRGLSSSHRPSLPDKKQRQMTIASIGG